MVELLMTHVIIRMNAYFTLKFQLLQGVFFLGCKATSAQNWEIDSDIIMLPVELGAPGKHKVVTCPSSVFHPGPFCR